MSTGFGHIARVTESSRIGPRTHSGRFFSNYNSHPWFRSIRKIGPRLPDGSFSPYMARCHRKRRYGISESDYTEMLSKQNGLCCICAEPLERDISVDHNHKTWEVRGLLHRRCNAALGGFRDSVESLKRAIVYLGGAL